MNTTSELTFVIPAKNEAKLIPRLLTSLTNQDYSRMSSTKVLVADANSTDGTREMVLSFRDCLNVSVIRGGMPSVGRNLGAAQAESDYVLFLDADIELAHPSVIRRAVESAQRGFHERVLFAEDYLLSQQVERKRFGIVRGGVYTTNRRFQKMGHLRVGWLFLKTAMNYWNQNYFLRDHKYWQT